jgi:predicted transcriptional regulator
MELSQRQQMVVDFCDTARTSDQIAEMLQIEKKSVYKYLRLLQRLDQIERVQPPNSAHNQQCVYRATGKPLAVTCSFTRYEPMVVMGVRL